MLALYLYFQLPFGKLHSGNPEIQELAAALERTNSSVAMKLCNFASLDPKITDSGRKGLDGASKLDRATYAEFGQDWTGLVSRAESLWTAQVGQFEPPPPPSRLNEKRSEFRFEPYQGKATTQALVNQRVGQDFFRRAVLANYEETCCITGIADPRLLTASHIKPWGKDSENRHNPANGLLLSATLDRAFDRGLITVDRQRRATISSNSRTRPCVRQSGSIPNLPFSIGTTNTALWINAPPDVSGGARTASPQYSLASMMVSTLRVTMELAGSSLSNRNSRSKASIFQNTVTAGRAGCVVVQWPSPS